LGVQQSDVSRILDTIEAEGFLHPTFIASGHGTVADVLGATHEVQTLLDNREASLPLLRARYREQDAIMADGPRLVYFVIFGLARDRQMLGEIVSYLKRVQGLSTSKLMWPWHPFLHGARALELITGGQVQAPDTLASAKQFDQFLTQVESWTKTEVDSPHQQQ
jgi:hypothetical protein